jgi:agmatinase
LVRKTLQTDSLKSPRFSGVSTFARLEHSKDLCEVDVAFVGIPFDDGTTFRPGTRFGPRSVRENSMLLRPYNFSQSVASFEKLNVIDYGDIDTVPGYIEDTFQHVDAGIREILTKNVLPISCGGDHSITLPILRAVASKFGPVSLLHIDAHLDCWDSYFGRKYNHGTVFRRALEEKLVVPEYSIHVGIRGSVYAKVDLIDVLDKGYHVMTMDDFNRQGITTSLENIIHVVASRKLYVSFDVDSCDPSIAPGTGTPEIGGFMTREILELVRGLKGLSFVGFDCVEVSPPYDSSGITALLSANLIYEFMSLVAHGKTT